MFLELFWNMSDIKDAVFNIIFTDGFFRCIVTVCPAHIIDEVYSFPCISPLFRIGCFYPVFTEIRKQVLQLL